MDGVATAAPSKRLWSYMKPLLLIVGLALIAAGIVFGFWAGIWWAFIGGIVDVISQIKAEHLDGTILVIGVLKFLCSSFIGWVSGVLAVIPGLALVRANL